MDCWRDKLPNGKPVECAMYETHEAFLKNDGEKFCKKHCHPGPRGKTSQSGSYIRGTQAWKKSMYAKPTYRQPVYGRKVA